MYTTETYKTSTTSQRLNPKHPPRIWCIVLILLCASEISQATSLTPVGQGEIIPRIQLGNRSLELVFAEIETKTGFTFSYRRRIVEQIKLPDTVLVNQSLDEVLHFISKKGNLEFKKIEKNIFVRLRSTANIISGEESHERIKITGRVLSEKDGSPLPGMSVIVKNENIGTTTDEDGKYSIILPLHSKLVFSFIGFLTTEVEVDIQSVINVTMAEEVKTLPEVVVTALGISREKKSLGYAVQQMDGALVSQTNETNIVNALAGKVAGAQITTSNTLGSSTNFLIRGTKTLSETNQPLFVVDGSPFDNSTYNSIGTLLGEGGYDFGNMAADINPLDIESISILKGGSAAALYGSRAMHGVIMITTKKGTSKKPFSLEFNSGLTFSTVNKKTVPKYQREYGAGYNLHGNSSDGGFYEIDLDGNPSTTETIPLVNDDASWGPKFDPNKMVYPWYALYPESPNFMKPSPWVAPAHGPDYFFETGKSSVSNVAISGNNDQYTYRASYTNQHTIGILPNQHMTKNSINFSTGMKPGKQWDMGTTINYISTSTLGRASTGYSKQNPMHSMGMFFQSNVDFKDLKDFYTTSSGRQMTWHLKSPADLNASYYNNPYWTRFNDYENDNRERIFGNLNIKYKITDCLRINGRTSLDYYNFKIENRITKGGSDIPGYSKVIRNYKERNNELFLTIDKTFHSGISIAGLAALSNRSEIREATSISKSQGIVLDNAQSIKNSFSKEIGYEDSYSIKKQRSIYMMASIGYKDLLFVGLTTRNDWSSTLQKGNNSYLYPSLSTSFIFSDLPALSNNRFLYFGKIRMNWAKVGNDTSPYNTGSYIIQYPDVITSGKIQHVVSIPTLLNNANLKPETKKSVEAGVELNFFKNRLGLDVTLYKDNTINQILAIETSQATGYKKQYVNSGNIENKGLELILKGTPIQTPDWQWNVSINWSANRNKVISLVDDDPAITNYSLGRFFMASINAIVNQPIGAIVGTNYRFNEQGQRLVDPVTGKYQMSNPEIIGNVNPDWNAGVYNSLTYKRISLGTLLDFQFGGDLFSLSTAFGRASGLFAETAGLNDLGNPKRDPVNLGGGILFEGVYPDGSSNTRYTPAEKYGQAWDYASTPAAMYVFDASYIKLRELTISYSIPPSLLTRLLLREVKVSFIGRNLAILYRDPAFNHFDPEVTRGAGNFQGYESGTYPTPRTYGFNLSFTF